MTGMDTYTELLRVPMALSQEMGLLDKNREKLRADSDNEKKNIQEDFEAAEAASAEVREKLKEEADARYESWNSKLNQYRGAADKTHNRAMSAMMQVFGESGDSMTMQSVIGKLDEETKQRKRHHKKDDNAGIVKLCEEEMTLSKNIRGMSEELRTEASAQKDREVNAAVNRYNAEHGAHCTTRDLSLAANRRKEIIRAEYEEEAFVERVERLILPDKVREVYRQMQDLQPSKEVFEPAEKIPEGIQFGYAGYDVTNHEKDAVKAAVLRKRFDFALREANGRTYLAMPYGYSFEDSCFSTMFEFTPGNRTEAAEDLRNLVLNFYMSIPVNKCWCTLIDPLKLGDTFALFTPLGEKDENGNGDERIIDTRIWSNERDIEERLQLIIDHTTDIIQRCLQGRYDNIIDYNEDAGINAEPLRFLVIMDFPLHFSDKSLDYLGSILDNGPKTGVYTLIAGDQAEMNHWPENSPVGRIRSRIKNTVKTDGQFLYVQEETHEGRMRFFPVSGPNTEQGIRIIESIQKYVGMKIIIPYQMVSRNLPDRSDYWFMKSALDGISVPIGLEGAGKIVNLEFGKPYQSYAALVSGTIGAGKSSLLHTIIQGVLFNYSPEDVKIYLLDFKIGVEFECYAKYKLPNFSVIALDTEPEFGLAVLSELHQEMIRRSGKFREAGVSSIEQYWKYKGERGESHADMPRILVIFDEVQALLTDESDEITQKCCDLIKVLVTMGAHAFGMHPILSTQTFENVKGLDNGVYSNMHTRFVLKSSKESVQMLLNNDNEIANRVGDMDPGQGIINTNAGDRDANRMYRGGLISAVERERWMSEIQERQLEVMDGELSKPRILFSGPADDIDNPLTIFVETGQRPAFLGDPAYHLYIGESLTMKNTYLPVLSAENGQNLLLAGRDMNNFGLPRMIIGYSLLSLLHETIRLKGEVSEPIFTVFDLSGRSIFGTGELDMLNYIENMVPEAFRIVPPNQILNGIQTLYQELYSGRQQFVVFYGLNRAKQLTTGTYERSPKEVLEQLFAEGPANGMNFIVWANDPGLFIDNYMMALNSFDNRLAFGMEDKEYKTITGENGPKNSSSANAISYNPIGDNEKIRMYKRPTEEWLNRFLTNVRKFIR